MSIEKQKKKAIVEFTGVLYHRLKKYENREVSDELIEEIYSEIIGLLEEYEVDKLRFESMLNATR